MVKYLALLLFALSAFGQAFTMRDQEFMWNVVPVVSAGGGPTFSPTNYAGLTYWFSPEGIAAMADGALISTWTNRATNGLISLTQAGTSRPYKTNSVSFANNNAAAVFATATAMLTASIGSMLTIINGDKQCLIIVMADANGTTGSDNYVWDIVSLSVGGTHRFMKPRYNGLLVYSSSDGTTGQVSSSANDGLGFHIWECVRNGASEKLLRDGVEMASRSDASGTLADQTGLLRINGASIIRGQIFEIINYNVVPSDSDRSTIRAALKATYGTP